MDTAGRWRPESGHDHPFDSLRRAPQSAGIPSAICRDGRSVVVSLSGELRAWGRVLLVGHAHVLLDRLRLWVSGRGWLLYQWNLRKCAAGGYGKWVSDHGC